MTSEPRSPPHVADAEAPANHADLSGQISDNIGSIVAFNERAKHKLGTAQRRVEHLSALIARPLYLVGVVCLVVLWVAWNTLAPGLGVPSFDSAPYARLQGLLTLAALLTATVVLIAQNREATLERQRAHLDLQVNLLTEQKVTKLIHLIEELRRDLPMVRDRHDPEVAALQEPTDTARMLSAIESVGTTAGVKKPAVDGT